MRQFGYKEIERQSWLSWDLGVWGGDHDFVCRAHCPTWWCIFPQKPFSLLSPWREGALWGLPVTSHHGMLNTGPLSR